MICAPISLNRQLIAFAPTGGRVWLRELTRAAIFLALLAPLALPQAARAAVVATADCLPPSGQHFKYLGNFHLHFGGTPTVDLTDPIHAGFTACVSPPASGSQTENFDSTVNFDVSINGGPAFHASAPAAVSVVVTFDSLVGTTRHFNTEMVQLDIGGGTLPPGVMVRESPTLASTGETSIEDLGGGMFAISSFFDVFAELSLDGGTTWIPSRDDQNRPSSGRVTLGVPAPATLALLGLGLAGVGFSRRMRW